MDPDRVRRIQELFSQALERAPAERASFLALLRSQEPKLADEVESLLAADLEVDSFLERPPGDVLAVLEKLQPGLKPGDRIDRYAILRLLGRGGMGRVYLAERADAQYEKQVAIKVVPPGLDTEEILKRFRRERQILANLEHPNIASLLDGGTTSDGRPYLVLEYVEGEPIHRSCDRGRVPIDGRLRLFRTVCAAVQYAHQNLVVHRDLKPSNILVTAAGVPKLLDFGIAKILESGDDSGSTTATRTGLRPMSPEYASPEQVRGGAITTATDVYSLGLVLYELLTGRRAQALESLSLAELERAVLEREPERPSIAVGLSQAHAPSAARATAEAVAAARASSPEGLRRKLIGDLDTIVMNALQKEAERRYTSVEALSQDIQRHLDGFPVRAHPETLSYRTAKFVRRHTVGVAAGALLTLTLAAGMTGILWQARRAAQERDRARTEAQKAETIAGFLTDLFRASDPNAALGDTVSVQFILERGHSRISTTLKDQPEVRATMLTVLGSVYRNLGRYNDARPLLEEALALRRQAYGTEDPRVAETLEDLATMFRQTRNFAAAAPLYHEALRVRRVQAANKQGDPDVQLQLAASLQGLAPTIRDLGQPDSAETLIREALAIRQRLQSADHADVIATIGALAYVLRAQGELDTAEALYRDVIPKQRALGDSARDELVANLNNLAYLLRLKQNYAAAETLYQEAVSRHRDIYGEAHPGTRMIMTNLAAVLYNQGKYPETEDILREAVRLERQYRPTGSGHAGVLVGGLGRFLSERGRCAEAEPLLRDGLKMKLDLEPAQPRTFEAESMLGACLTELGRFTQAEPLLIHGYEGLRSAGAAQNQLAKSAVERLVRLYEAWGRSAKAATYRSQLAALHAP